MRWTVPLSRRLLGLALLTLGVAPPTLGAQETAGGLSLSQAVEMAFRNNPLLQASRAGRSMADAGLQEARAGWFPTLQAGASFTRSSNPVFVFGSLLEQSRFSEKDFAVDQLNDPDPYNNFRGTLSVRLPLFDQLQTWTRVARAQIGGDQAGRRSEAAEQQVRFEVIRTYFEAVVAEARQRVAEEAVKTAEADVKRVQDLFDAGLVVRSDLLASQVQLSEFHHERIQAAGEVAVSHAALNTALGLPVVTAHRLSDGLVGRTFEVPSEEALLATALQRRPDYAAAAVDVRAAEETARGATGQYLPRLDAFGSYGGSGKSLGIDSTDYTLGAALTVDLLDMGRSARVDQARAGVALAAAERQQAANRVGLEVVRAYRQYLSARERGAVALGAAEQAAEALRIVQDRYQAGLTTVTEVLRAETAYLSAQNREIAARYDHCLGFASILLATGTLTDVGPFAP